jgi:hypothetical protein
MNVTLQAVRAAARHVLPADAFSGILRRTRMHWLPIATLLAEVLVAASAVPAASQPVCRPALALATSAHSDVLNQQRRWTGIVTVDAARCATSDGAFAIEFVRHKENAPVTSFVQHFTWRPGQTEIAAELWEDEWVDPNRITDITPCPCRE